MNCIEGEDWDVSGQSNYNRFGENVFPVAFWIDSMVKLLRNGFFFGKIVALGTRALRRTL